MNRVSSYPGMSPSRPRSASTASVSLNELRHVHSPSKIRFVCGSASTGTPPFAETGRKKRQSAPLGVHPHKPLHANRLELSTDIGCERVAERRHLLRQRLRRAQHHARAGRFRPARAGGRQNHRVRRHRRRCVRHPSLSTIAIDFDHRPSPASRAIVGHRLIARESTGLTPC